MNLELKEKVVIVSGGAGKPGSIGETIVRGVAEEGAIPIIFDKDVTRIRQLSDQLHAAGHKSLAVPCDMTVEADVHRAVSRVVAEYGRINAVVNNLGMNDGVGLDAPFEKFIASIKLNLGSAFLLVRHAREALVSARGSIVNIGSKVALTGQGGTSAYAAAKGGLLALTREWAVDLVHAGVRSNAVVLAESWTPSYDDWISTKTNRDELLERITRHIPLENRMTRPEEVSDAVLFLISARASHITGQHIFVDGGYVHLDRSLEDLNS
jgi:L-fucose dehydrogenase